MTTLMVDPTSVLMAMVGSLITEGIEPGYLRVSPTIVEFAGWYKIIRHSDSGGDYLMGMRLVYAERDILAVSGVPFTDDGSDEVTMQPVHLDDGRSFLRVERED